MRPFWIIALLFSAFGPQAFGGDFYQQFLSLVDTNQFTQPLAALRGLVDTNNTGIKVTNEVLDLGSLKQSGEISGVRLGMTIQEVVDCWGKPRGGWTRCLHGLITLSYDGVSLGFEGNNLETIRFWPPPKLAGDLLSTSSESDFVRVLGSPTSRRVSEEHCYLVYLSRAANLVLYFGGGELKDISLERTPGRAEPWKQGKEEAIKLASRLRLGMREKDATTLLERAGLKCELMRAGDGTHWLNFCDLIARCSLTLEFTNSPGKVGHWEDGRLERAYIASNGVSIVSISLTNAL